MNRSEWDTLDDPADWQGIQDGGAIPFAGFDGVTGGDTSEMEMNENSLFGEERGTPALLTRGSYHNRACESTVELPQSAQHTAGEHPQAPPQMWSGADPAQRINLRQPPKFGNVSGGFDPDPSLFDAEANAFQHWQQDTTEESGALLAMPTYALLAARGQSTEEEADKRFGSPEDAAFSEVLATVMHGQRSPAQALKAYAAICRRGARELRTMAAGQLQRATRYVALRDEANALDEEAATWQLLWHLAGDSDARFPGGWGGGEEAAAATLESGRTTVHQQVAAIIASDDDINRASRVVAWLEALAGKALDTEEALTAAGGGTAGRFGATEGVWTETQLRLAAGVSLQGSHKMVSELDPDAPGRQRRSLHPENTADQERILSRLWRLIRAGRVEEAQALCRECGQPWRAASLGGGGRWGPTPVGASAAAADAQGGTELEDEDEMAAQVADGDTMPRSMWRCSLLHAAEAAATSPDTGGRGLSANTLEAAVYGALAADLASVLPACKGWEDTVWALTRCWLDITVDSYLSEGMEFDAEHSLASELVVAAVPGDGGTSIALDMQTVQAGGWPLHRIAARLPQHFGAIFSDAQVVEAATVQAAMKGHHRGLQAALILNHPQQVVDHLVAWVLPGGGEQGGGSAGDMRFAAHFAVALRATGFIDQPSWQADQYDPLQEAIGEVLQAYLVHAMSSGAAALVPQLSCHLRAGRRHLTYAIFAEQLTARPMAESRTAFEEASAWFDSWHGGDVLPTEMLIIANQIAQATRASPAGGPAFRVQSARWLTFSETTVAAALRHAVLIARELALGLAAAPGPSTAAACALLHEVLPSGPPGRLLTMSQEHLSKMQLPKDLASSLAEVRLWSEVFANEHAFQEFQRQKGDAGGQPSDTTAAQLLAVLSAFLTGGRFEALLTALQGSEEEEAVMKITAVPVALVRPATDAEATALTNGTAYPVVASDDEDETVRLLQDSLLAAIAASPALEGLEVCAEKGDSAAAGLLSIHLRAVAPAAGWSAVQVVAATATAVIKSALPGAAVGVGLLWVIHADGSDSCVANTAWRLVAPRIALQAAELRQAAVAAGVGGEVSCELATTVAGVLRQVGQPAVGLAPLFSSRELQEFLDWERSTTLIAMHHNEGTVQQQQQQTNSEHITLTNSDDFVML